MSRQAGKRDRPAPERKAIRERYSRRVPRREPSERTPPGRRTTTGRRWAAVLNGTIVSVVAFTLLATSIVAVGDGDTGRAIASGAGAALLLPVLFLVVAFVSRTPNPWRIAFLAGGGAAVLVLAASLLVRDPATGYVLGVSMGTVYALRLDEGVHNRGWRRWTAIGLAAYTKVVYLLAPGLAIVAAPLLPVAGIAIMDSVAERRLRDRGRPLA